MNSYSLTPLLRQSIGFDRFSELFDTVLRGDENNPTYPPYNIEKLSDGKYRITMAVAGFSLGDINITAEGNQLTVQGKSKHEEKEENIAYIYKGIAARAFERKFSLADHVKVNGASLLDGLLKIDLVHEIPEENKSRTIEIKNGETKNGSGRTAAANLNLKK